MSFLEKFKNKKMIIITSSIIIIALGVGFIIYKKNNMSNEEISMTENVIETYTIADSEKVFINGTIIPTKTKDFNPSSGEVSKINITNGKVVKEGDLLFTTKNQSILDEIDSLKSQVKELKRANTQNDLLINTEINKLNAQISVLDKNAYVNTYAPFAGKVYLNEDSNNNAMETPSSLMTLVSNEYYMKGQASEQDLVKLQIDDPVDVLIFSNNKTIPGRISFISDRPTDNVDNMNTGSQSNLSYYDVNVSFESQENLVNGFHVQASVKVDNSLVKIPSSAVLKDEDNTTYVFKDLDGVLKKQVVEIYDQNEDITTINNGLKANDIVVRYADVNMKEGDLIDLNSPTEGPSINNNSQESSNSKKSQDDNSQKGVE